MTNPAPLKTFMYDVVVEGASQLSGEFTAHSYMVDAAYYQIENGWVSFKDADHKAVWDFPAARVQMIKRVDPPKPADG